jgi:hypothetical protein
VKRSRDEAGRSFGARLHLPKPAQRAAYSALASAAVATHMSFALISHRPLVQQGEAAPHETLQPGLTEHPAPSVLTAATYCDFALTLIAGPPQHDLGSATMTQSESVLQDWS